MDAIPSPSSLGAIHLTFAERADRSYLNATAALIRQTGGVRLVRVDLAKSKLEIFCERPIEGLLQKIHTACIAVRAGVAAWQA